MMDQALIAFLMPRMPGVGELQYVQECVRGPGVPIPEMASMPVRFVGDPHKYIKQLNGGELPYFHDGASRAIAGDASTKVKASFAALLYVSFLGFGPFKSV